MTFGEKEMKGVTDRLCDIVFEDHRDDIIAGRPLILSEEFRLLKLILLFFLELERMKTDRKYNKNKTGNKRKVQLANLV
jgi:hypothetical protein